MAPLYIHGQLLDQVQSLNIWVPFWMPGSVTLDVQDKIGKASHAFGTLQGECQDRLQRMQNAGTHTVKFVCETCHQEFQRSQDIARHKFRQLGHRGRNAGHGLVYY